MNLPQAYERTQPTKLVEVNLTVNGSEVSMTLPSAVTPSDALRDHLGLTGTHVGCEHGICGMCTVLVDGDAARACLLFAVQLDGADAATVEGLGPQATTCTRSRNRSVTTTGCSAGSAHPASS